MSGVLLKSPATITAAGPAALAKSSNLVLVAVMPVRHEPNESVSDATGEMTCTLATSGSKRTPGTRNRAAAEVARLLTVGDVATGNRLYRPIPPASAAGLSTEQGNASPIPAWEKSSTSSGITSSTVTT